MGIIQTDAAILPDDADLEKQVNDDAAAAGEQFAAIDDEDTTQHAPAAKSAPAPAATDDELPDDLRGKSAAEIAKMYKEAQKLIGRQGQELGTMRQYADQLIKADLARRAGSGKVPVAPAPKKPEDVDFFADPNKSVETAVAQHPALKKLAEDNARLQSFAQQTMRERAEAAFVAQNPDAAEIIGDEGFRKWVGASKVRMALLRSANERWDVDAANELFGTWRELNAAKKADAAKAAETAKAATAGARKAAAVPSSGNARTDVAAGKGKVYRRVDIQRLMVEDPARYEAMADEIQRAYQEGRVR